MQPQMKEKNMKPASKQTSDELRPEYEFDYSKAIRGKYCQALLKEQSVIILEADVARSFPDSASVNEALRSLLEIADATRRLKRRSNKRKEETRPTNP